MQLLNATYFDICSNKNGFNLVNSDNKNNSQAEDNQNEQKTQSPSVPFRNSEPHNFLIFHRTQARLRRKHDQVLLHPAKNLSQHEPRLDRLPQRPSLQQVPPSLTIETSHFSGNKQTKTTQACCTFYPPCGRTRQSSTSTFFMIKSFSKTT